MKKTSRISFFLLLVDGGATTTVMAAVGEVQRGTRGQGNLVISSNCRTVGSKLGVQEVKAKPFFVSLFRQQMNTKEED